MTWDDLNPGKSPKNCRQVGRRKATANQAKKILKFAKIKRFPTTHQQKFEETGKRDTNDSNMVANTQRD